MDLTDHNVLFVTVDCCRYDTYQRARTPNLDQLGKARRAGTMGTYTLPAHMSFFMGYLPFVNEAPYERYYSPEVCQLWRLSSGRQKAPDQIGVAIQRENVLADYSARGFNVVGYGGVRWFRHPALAGLFDHFDFMGESDYHSVFADRKAHEFPLSQTNHLVESISSDKFFLFVNAAETHVPYDFGEGALSADGRRIIEKYRDIWGFKAMKASSINFEREEFELLHLAQIAALEAVDRKLGELLARLPRPLLVIVSGDHGECFGEDMAWGHGFPHPKVYEVPLLIATLDH